LAGHSQDPFFTQPYQEKPAPAAEPGEPGSPALDAVSKAATRRRNRGPIPALLGGLKRAG
jgi:hypothetical protein